MLLAAWLVVTPALAFEPNTNDAGAETAWDVMPVWWRYEDAGRPANLTRDEAEAAVRGAFESWNNAPGARVRFIEDDGNVADAEVNRIVWQPAWSWDSDILALTRTWTLPDGEIVHFDVTLNAEDPVWSTSGANDTMDLQNAMTHEVGHALGLGHDEEHASATMAPTASPGETRKRDLHRSDEDGARYLYPATEAAPIACSTTPAPAAAGLLALAVTLLGFRRRTR